MNLSVVYYGRSIVVHAGQDDLGQGGDEGSRSTGNAGKRIDCCLIKRDGLPVNILKNPAVVNNTGNLHNSASKMVLLPTVVLVFSVQFVFFLF